MNSENKFAKSSALDIPSRMCEILFGLIMVLSFTTTISVTEAGREDIREMLIGALGCNLAWGFIDAVMFLMNTVTERGRGLLLLKKLQLETDASQAREYIKEVLPEKIGELLEVESLENLRLKLKAYDVAAERLIIWSDLKNSFVVFALVFLSTFPVVIPFLFMQEPQAALRQSNLIAIFMLVNLGYVLGKYAGRNPWIWGLLMALVGVALVMLTVALGG